MPRRVASPQRPPLPSPPSAVPSSVAITAAPSVLSLSEFASHPAPASPGTRARPPSGNGERPVVAFSAAALLYKLIGPDPVTGVTPIVVFSPERAGAKRTGTGRSAGTGTRRGAVGRRRRANRPSPLHAVDTSAPGNLEEAVVDSAHRAVEDLVATLRLEDETIVLDVQEAAELHRQLVAHAHPNPSDAERRGTTRFVRTKIQLGRSTASVAREVPGSGFLASAPLHRPRVQMNHPYSSPAASAIYANEPDAAPKHPHFAPARARRPGAHDNRWVTVGTYTPRPLPRAGPRVGADPPGYSQCRPLPPLPHEKHPAVAELESGWVSDSEDDESESEGRASNDTVVAPTPPTKATTPQPQFKTTIIRYEGEDAPLVSRPAPVPYETRLSERALAARKHAAWRKKIADIMCVKLD
ncbi:hypothetical protein FB451DRAFT_1392999 [Mycena latifolia]|nr:hypothetical protein FB451DRAFT_1392999 [Mycena latifolia]